jgi:hypothetical protein
VSIANAEEGREPEMAGVELFFSPGKRVEGLLARVRVLSGGGLDAAVVVAWVGESTVAAAR